MREQDKPKFKALLDDMQGALGRKSMTAGAMRIWWEICSDMDIDLFARAIAIYMRAGDWPSPAAIRTAAGANVSHWPGPEVAWDMAPKTTHQTSWIFPEVERALASCADSLERGDMISARLAFVEAYCQNAVRRPVSPLWRIRYAEGLPEGKKVTEGRRMLLSLPEGIDESSIELEKVRIEAIERRNSQRIRMKAQSTSRNMQSSVSYLSDLRKVLDTKKA